MQTKGTDKPHPILALTEVQLFSNGKRISNSSLSFSLSSTHFGMPALFPKGFSASNCNDGDLADGCGSTEDGSDKAPTLVITGGFPALDRVVVYNREDCCEGRIVGATITYWVGSQAVWTYEFVIKAAIYYLSIPSGIPFRQRVCDDPVDADKCIHASRSMCAKARSGASASVLAL